MFAFLDRIQERIAALSLRVVFDDGAAEADVQDLQVRKCGRRVPPIDAIRSVPLAWRFRLQRVFVMAE